MRLYSDLASYRPSIDEQARQEYCEQNNIPTGYRNCAEIVAQSSPRRGFLTDSPANRKLLCFLDNPSVSFWLKNAIRSSLDRDCVDALNDAEQLVAILTERLAQ